MKIFFVTNNVEKLATCQRVFQDSGIELVQARIETPEIQSANGREIAEYSAAYAAQKVNHAVIKTDAAWHLEGLNGFPGPFVKFVNQWLTVEDFLRLLNNKNRRVKVVEYVAYCEPNSSPVSFEGSAFGKIADSPGGERGSPINQLFIPDGKINTAAELPLEEMAAFWAQHLDGFVDLREYLKNKDALWSLAVRKQLPKHQCMDKSTLEFICRKTKPIKPARVEKPLIDESTFNNFLPTYSRFESRLQSDGIHGLAHHARVLLYALILADRMQIMGKEREGLLWAAGFHDVGRVIDKEDKGHGKRSASKVENNIAKSIIELHDTNQSARETDLVLVKILKNADALDRFRLPKQKWHPNPDLMDSFAVGLMESAKFLTCETEKKILEGSESVSAVIEVAEELGWVSR